MESVQIIEFQPQYTQAVKDLARRVLQDVGIKPDTVDLYMESDLEAIAGIYKDRQRFWVALDGSWLVGTIAIAEIDQTTARLRRMFVSPRFQGKGVGQRLFDTALRFTQENGYTKIIL